MTTNVRQQRWVVNDTLFYVGSTWKRDHPIWKTADPKSGRWTRHVDKAMLPTWDPAIFQDDDKKYICTTVQAENCHWLE